MTSTWMTKPCRSTVSCGWLSLRSVYAWLFSTPAVRIRFSRTMKRTMAKRSIGRGLAKVEPTMSDTLIAFAAKAGSTASDGDGRNSPFVIALLKHLAEPGLDLRIAFGRVRDDVMLKTDNEQEPFVYGSLGGSIVSLMPAKVDDLATGARPEASQQANLEITFWNTIKDDKNPAPVRSLSQALPERCLCRHRSDHAGGFEDCGADTAGRAE